MATAVWRHSSLVRRKSEEAGVVLLHSEFARALESDLYFDLMLKRKADFCRAVSNPAAAL